MPTPDPSKQVEMEKLEAQYLEDQYWDNRLYTYDSHSYDPGTLPDVDRSHQSVSSIQHAYMVSDMDDEEYEDFQNERPTPSGDVPMPHSIGAYVREMQTTRSMSMAERVERINAALREDTTYVTSLSAQMPYADDVQQARAAIIDRSNDLIQAVSICDVRLESETLESLQGMSSMLSKDQTNRLTESIGGDFDTAIKAAQAREQNVSMFQIEMYQFTANPNGLSKALINERMGMAVERRLAQIDDRSEQWTKNEELQDLKETIDVMATVEAAGYSIPQEQWDTLTERYSAELTDYVSEAKDRVRDERSDRAAAGLGRGVAVDYSKPQATPAAPKRAWAESQTEVEDEAETSDQPQDVVDESPKPVSERVGRMEHISKAFDRFMQKNKPSHDQEMGA